MNWAGCRKRSQMIILRLFKAALALLLTVLLLVTLGWVWFAASIFTMKPDSPDTKTDAIIVLTGGKKRIAEGVRLLETGASEQLFISGVNPQTSLPDLIGDKNPPCCITLGYKAENTIGNADEARAWIEKNKFRSIRLVTSNYHMTRAKIEFDRALPGLAMYEHPIPSDDKDITRRSFLELTFREYAKLIGAFVRTDSKQ